MRKVLIAALFANCLSAGDCLSPVAVTDLIRTAFVCGKIEGAEDFLLGSIDSDRDKRAAIQDAISRLNKHLSDLGCFEIETRISPSVNVHSKCSPECEGKQ